MTAARGTSTSRWDYRGNLTWQSKVVVQVPQGLGVMLKSPIVESFVGDSFVAFNTSVSFVMSNVTLHMMDEVLLECSLLGKASARSVSVYAVESLSNYPTSHFGGPMSNGQFTVPSRSMDGDTQRTLRVVVVQVRMPFGFVGTVPYVIRLGVRRTSWNSQFVYHGNFTVEDLEIPWPVSILLPYQPTLAFGAWTPFVLNVTNVTGLVDVSLKCSDDVTVYQDGKWILGDAGGFHVATVSNESLVSWTMSPNVVARTSTTVQCNATTASVDIPSHSTSVSWTYEYLPNTSPIMLPSTVLRFTVAFNATVKLDLSTLFTDDPDVRSFATTECSLSWNASHIQWIELDEVAVASSFQQVRQPLMNCSNTSIVHVHPAVGFLGDARVILLISSHSTVKPVTLQFHVQAPIPTLRVFAQSTSSSIQSRASLVLLEASAPHPCHLQLQMADLVRFQFQGQTYTGNVTLTQRSLRQQAISILPPDQYMPRQVVNLSAFSTCPFAQSMAVSTQFIIYWLRASPPSLNVSCPLRILATDALLANITSALHPQDADTGKLTLDVVFNSSQLSLNNRATMLEPNRFRVDAGQPYASFIPLRFFSGVVAVRFILTSYAFDTTASAVVDQNIMVLPVASSPVARLTTSLLCQNEPMQLSVVLDPVSVTGYIESYRALLILDALNVAAVANLTCAVVSTRLYCPLTPGFVRFYNQSIVVITRKQFSGSMNVSTLVISAVNTPPACLENALTVQDVQSCCRDSPVCNAVVDQSTLYVQGIPQPPEFEVTPTRLSSTIQGSSWVFVRRAALADPSQTLAMYVACPFGVLRNISQTRAQLPVPLKRSNYSSSMEAYQVQLSGVTNSMGIEFAWHSVPSTLNMTCSLHAVVTEPLEGTTLTTTIAIAVELVQVSPLVQLRQTYFEMDEGRPFALPLVVLPTVQTVTLECPPRLCANITWSNGPLTRQLENVAVLSGAALRNGSFVVTLVNYTTGILPFNLTATSSDRAMANQTILVQVVVQALPTLPVVDLSPKVAISAADYVDFQLRITPLDWNDELSAVVSVPSQQFVSLWSPGWTQKSSNDTVEEYWMQISSLNESVWHVQGILRPNVTAPFMVNVYVTSTVSTTKETAVQTIPLTVVPSVPIARVLTIESEEDSIIGISVGNARHLWDMEGDVVVQVWMNGQSRLPQTLSGTSVRSWTVPSNVSTVYIQNQLRFTGFQKVYLVGDVYTLVNIVVKPKRFTARLSMPSRTTVALSIAAQTSVQLAVPRGIPVAGTVGLRYVGPQGRFRLYAVQNASVQVRVAGAFAGAFRLTLESGGGFQMSFDVRIFPMAVVPQLSNAPPTLVVNATQTSVVLAPQSADDIFIVDSTTGVQTTSPLTLQWPRYQTSTKTYVTTASSTQVASSPLTVSTAQRVVTTTVAVIAQPVPALVQLERLQSIVAFPTWTTYWNDNITCRFQVTSPDTTGNQVVRVFVTVNSSQIQLVRYNATSVSPPADGVVEIIPAKPTTYFVPSIQLELVPRFGFAGDVLFGVVARSTVRDTSNSVDTTVSWNVTVVPTASVISLQFMAVKSRLLETDTIMMNTTVGTITVLESLTLTVSSSAANLSLVEPLKIEPNRTFSLQIAQYWFGVFDVTMNATVQHRIVSPRDRTVVSRTVRMEIVPIAYPPVLVVPYVVPSAPLIWSPLSITQFSPFLPNRVVPLETMRLFLRVSQVGLSLRSNTTVLKVMPNVMLEVLPSAQVMGTGGVYNVTFIAIHRIPSSNTSATTTSDQILRVAGISTDVNSTSIVEGQGILLSVALQAPPLNPVALNVICTNSQRITLNASTATLNDTSPWNIALATTRDNIDRGDVRVNCSVQVTTQDPYYNQVDGGRTGLFIQDPDVSGFDITGPMSNRRVQLVVAEGVFGDSYAIRLNTIPFASVTVALSCEQERVGIFPPTLTFSPDDWNVRQTITVNATDDFIRQGIVDTSIVHSVASDDPVYASLANFTVALRTIETADRTPAPMAQQLYFGDTGADLILTFNRAVDQTNFTKSNFSCAVVFNVTGTGLFGDNPVCSWPNTRTIRVVLGRAPTVLPKDIVTLNGNVLKSTPEAILSMSSTSMQVELPRRPPVPRTTVSGPLNLGSCDHLSLNARASSGSGGRQMVWQWTVDPPGILDGLGLTNQTIWIPSDELSYGGVYTITLTLTNFFGMNATSDKLVVTKASMPLPSVYIEGPSQVTLLRSQSLQLSSVASVSTCGNATTNPSMGFAWSVNNVPVVSESRNPRQLKLSGLDVGVHTVTVLVFMSDRPEVNNTASVAVQIKPSPLTALIVGGNRTVGNGDDLLLNGTRSFDPDNRSTSLEYLWACTDPNTGRTSCNGEAILDGGVTTIARDNLPPKQVIQITLTVFDPMTGRRASTSISLTIVLGNPPVTKIVSLATTKFNPDAKIVLSGSVSSVLDAKPTATWAIDGDQDGSIAAAAFGLSAASLRMVVVPNSLRPGRSYGFVLTGKDKFNQLSSATMTIAMNEAPTSGNVEVTPASGTTLSTVFRISCNDWVDEDLPLKFSFKYIVGEYSPDVPQVTLSDYSLTTSFDTVFPTGGGPNNTITIISYIADALGYTTQSISTVQVTLPQLDAEAQASFMQNQTSELENLASSKDPGKVLNMVNILASMMAPTVNDTEVETTPTPSPTTAAPSATDSAGSPAPTPVRTRPPKRCPTAISGTSCSGHGSCTTNPPQCSDDILECTAICTCGNSWYGTDCSTSQEDYDRKQKMLGSLLNSMAIANANVEPTPQALEQQSSAVASIAANVAVLSPTQQSQALDLVANILSSSSSVTLSPATTAAVGQSISSLLDATPVASTVSQSGQRLLQGQDAKSTRVGNTVSMLATSMLSDHEPGEVAVQLNTKNLKLTLQRHEPSELSTTVVDLPLTAEQIKRNYTSPSFAFPDTFSTHGCDDFVDSHAALYASNLYSDESSALVNSAVMGLNLKCGDKPLPVANLSKGFVIRMRNNMQYPAPPAPSNGTVQCFANDTTVTNITCDAANQLFKIVACNGTMNYTVLYTCPQYVPVSVCRYWDASLGAWSSEGCVQVSDPDPDYIVCECNHLTDFTSQVNQALRAVEDNVVAVFSHKTTLEDVKQNIQVVVTMGIFFILYGAGLLYGMRRDRLDAIGYSQELKKLMEVKNVDMTNLFQLPKVLSAKTRTEKLKALVHGFWNGMTSKHQLLSIFLTYDPDFTRPQRLMIIFTTIMSQMFINAVLYRLRQLEPNIGTMIVSGLISSVVMMPVTLAFVMLYKKSAKKREYLVRYHLEDSENEVEVQVDAYGNPVEYTKYQVLCMDLHAAFNRVDAASYQACHRVLQQDGIDGTMIGALSRAIFIVVHGHDVFEQPPPPLADELVVKSSISDVRQKKRSSRKMSRKTVVERDPVISTIQADNILPPVNSHEAMAKCLAMWGNQGLHTVLMKVEPTQLSPAATAQLAAQTKLATDKLNLSRAASEVADFDGCHALLEYCVKFHECAECFANDNVSVLRHAQDEIRRAKEELVAVKQLLKSQASQRFGGTVRRSLGRLSKSSMNETKTVALHAVKDQVKVVVHTTKRHMSNANTRQKQARKSLQMEQVQMKKHSQAEIQAVLANLKGLQRWKKRYQMYMADKESKRLAAMPLHERQFFLKETEKLRSLRMTSRLLYNQFLRRQPERLPKPLFPAWVNYILYVMCACIDGFAAWFVLQFAFTIGGDLANVFIGSVVTGLVMTWVVSDPIKIFFKMGILPVFATALLANTGIFDALSAETFALGATAAVGVAGVAKLRGKKAQAAVDAALPGANSPKKMHVANEALARVRHELSDMPNGSPTEAIVAEMEAATQVEYLQAWEQVHESSLAAEKLPDDALLNEAERKRRSVVKRTGPTLSSLPPATINHPDHVLFPDNYMDMPAPSDVLVDVSGPSTGLVPFSTETFNGDVCQCGSHVALADRVKHVTLECSHRMVQCRNPDCGLFMPARGLAGHEGSQCRLVLCVCDRMIPKYKLRQHQLSDECAAKIVRCRMGCGIATLSVKHQDKHERTECPLRPMECPKCHVVLQVRDHPAHDLECIGTNDVEAPSPVRVKGPALAIVAGTTKPLPKRKQLAPLRLTKRVYVASMADDDSDAVGSDEPKVTPMRITGPPLAASLVEARIQSGLASAAKSTLEERTFHRAQARSFLQENTRRGQFDSTENSLFGSNATQPSKPSGSGAMSPAVAARSSPYKLKQRAMYHGSDDEEEVADA
ncbi:hypothetical protein H310_13163 [Aphanomyces invadans]|uniref:PKD/REJ-like domain-containing protein n=1 Tax=Aphanomyces invadans TaxID=157072 RepID=A0A024TEL7_9STRA|nr:hypothetical protein H310_13163 [Aphanomyces invadans]ETV92473.1 hypothetical protein H310_13163 [Aphanomyces invadans]|eukprot:XP_008878780.1 hypothetical protein H310_13163 [Aphanomyces invadans]